ncbi:long-chain fatty acid transport protein [Shewanella psychrophila]|uniref:Long-chain fatty acid transport protein n=1 Tax=Shewanella psychrophila TaxID=225848 RepID=A0A1S6HNQ5_9GAMM|nr:outer membrane protein transport protein [Shewanella psychrophila]AQS37150.1 long-chain fatty acid transport protein [Shewanella psychrophila]
MKHFPRTYTCLAVLLATHQAVAAGFQINAQSATGLGRAFAGDGIIADNASVMAKNSAAMSLIETPELSFGGVAVLSSVDVSAALYTPIVGDTVDASVDDIAEDAFIPNAYYVHPIEGTDFTLGASVYSNFGTNIVFPEDYVAREFGGETSLTSVNFGIALSYQVTNKFSLGGGIDVIYGDGDIKRKGLLDVEADGVGYGFNLGLAYEFDRDNRIGLSYRYSPDIEAKGEVSMGGESADSINIPLPDMLELSGYHKLTEKFAFHYSVQYVAWSEFNALTSEELSSSIKEYQWVDAGHISIGGTYYLSPQVELRAGYMYDKAPTDSLSSLSIPDSNRQWLSAGASYHLSDKQSVDLGVSYVLGEDEVVEESLTIIPGTQSSIKALTTADAWLIGAQYSYRF